MIAVPAIAASALMQDPSGIDANVAEDKPAVQNEVGDCATGNMTMDAYRERCAEGIYGDPATWNTAAEQGEGEPNMTNEAPPAEPER